MTRRPRPGSEHERPRRGWGPRLWRRRGLRAPRRAIWVAAFAAAGALTLAVAPTGARAATPTLLGWTAQADANVVDVVIDTTNGLSGVHPVDEVDIPEDTSDFETGPFGTALASVVWPGSTGGNIGSLSGELGLPSQLAPLASQLNDTVKAQSFYPSGPQNDTFPGGSTPAGVADMKTSTTATGSTATSDLSNLSLAGIVAVQGSTGASKATAASEATATATGSFSQISLLGGLITIGATTSTATATSTGTSATGSGATHLGAMSIAGQQVSVGSDGLTVGPVSTTLLDPLLGNAAGAAQTVIHDLGLSVTPLPENVTSSGAVEKVTSGGFQVKFSLPASGTLNLTCPTLPAALSQLGVLCTLPALFQGANVTITIGRATAEAIATPPFAVGSFTTTPSAQMAANVPPPSAPLPPSAGTSAGSPLPAAPPPPGSTGSVSTGSSASGAPPPSTTAAATATPTPAAATTPAATASPALAAVPISLSRPVKTGVVVGMLFLALLLAAGAAGLGNRLDATDLKSCPNGESPPTEPPPGGNPP